jgi:hypothetical protein
MSFMVKRTVILLLTKKELQQKGKSLGNNRLFGNTATIMDIHILTQGVSSRKKI